MSLYLGVLLLLASGALLEWIFPKYREIFYWICWGAMTALLCLRFGQGVDYVTYDAIYRTIPVAIDLSQGYICGLYPEIGWRLLMAFFKMLQVPFWVIAMMLGFCEMLLLHRFLQRHVPMKTAGLFMLYPVVFLVYMVSGLRQGLAMCIFLGVALPFYVEKKWLAYILCILVAASFHSVGFLWLILCVVAYIPVKVISWGVLISIICGLTLQIGEIKQVLDSVFPSYHLHQLLYEGNVNYFALAERLVSFCVIFMFYVYRKKNQSVKESAESLLKAYICGVCLYMVLSINSYYASRFAVIFKIVEGALVINLFEIKKLWTNVMACFFFCLTLFMGVKNLNAIIEEAYYYDPSEIKIWNIPYVSIFQQEKINEYYPYAERIEEIYNNNIEDQEVWRVEK